MKGLPKNVLDIHSCPSPNFDDRKGVSPSLVLFHYTGMQDGPSALKHLCDESAKVSAHYLIEEDGRIFQMVDDNCRAWHAGVGYWRGMTDINAHSIGIEIVNKGHAFGYAPFPDRQMQAVLKLALVLKDKHNLNATGFIGHSDVAPLRKTDPGEFFDWQGLAKQGIGFWPEDYLLNKDMTEKEAIEFLVAIGYGPLAEIEKNVSIYLTAFQRHFVPHELSGLLGHDTRKMLSAAAAFLKA